MRARLKEVLHRVENWPGEAQDELERVALEIEAEQSLSDYQATPEELASIDQALAQVERGELASDAEIKAAFAHSERTFSYRHSSRDAWQGER